MPLNPLRRAALLLPSGPAHDRDRLHLHIVLTDAVTVDPAQPDAHVVVVSVSSVVEGAPHDSTCYLEVGDHPFIRHRSYVFYAVATAYPIATLEQMVVSGEIEVREPVSEDVMVRVTQGLLDSRHSKPRWKGIVRHANRTVL